MIIESHQLEVNHEVWHVTLNICHLYRWLDHTAVVRQLSRYRCCSYCSEMKKCFEMT